MVYDWPDIDLKKFREAFKITRSARNIGLREASKEMANTDKSLDLSASSLSRMENGEKEPSAREFLLICGWMQIDYAEFITAQGRNTKGLSTLERIEILLRTDDKLPETAALSIANLVKIAYGLTSQDQ